MRVRDIQTSGGSPVTSQFSKGDTFEPIDGPHDECKSRSTVIGFGLARKEAGEAKAANQEGATVVEGNTTYVYVPGLLFRCNSCLGSYVIASKQG